MQPKKHYFAQIPTIAIFVAFAVSAPLGLLLLILKSIDKNAQKEEQSAAGLPNTPPVEIRPARTPPMPGAAAAPAPDRPTYDQQTARKRQKDLTALCTVIGAIFLVAGFAGLTDVFGLFPYYIDWGVLFSSLAQMIGGGAALFTGLHMRRTHKLEQLLDTIVGSRDNIPLAELFAAAGVEEAKGRTTLQNAIEHGYFGADAYIDNRTGTLVVRGAAPQPPRPEPAPQPKAPAEPADEYAALLQQLRQANAAIPDPVMTAKISRLEAVSARIFELAKQDSGKKAQLQKFMGYYLPTALKLLNTYASLAAQDVQGENITEAKQNIERSMDLLISAFENQLDKLFQSDALDVSADIAALEGMLNMDGLTGSDFTK